MDLSHISQDKILPEVDLVSHEDDKSKTYFIHPGSGDALVTTKALLFFYSVWCQVLNMVQVHVVSDIVTVLLAGWHSANLNQCREFVYSCTLVLERSSKNIHGCKLIFTTVTVNPAYIIPDGNRLIATIRILFIYQIFP